MQRWVAGQSEEALRAAYVATSQAGKYVTVGAPTGGDDTAQIHAARDLAGVGGRLIFSAGTYRTTGLTAIVAGQTWDLWPGAAIKSTDGATASVIIARAAYVTIRSPGGGVIDGNRANVPSSVAGIYSYEPAATDLRIEGLRFQHVAGYGIQAAGSRTRVLRNSFSDIAANAVLIAPETAADLLDPEVFGNDIDRSGESAATLFTAIQIRGNNSTGAETLRPRISNNSVRQPWNPTNNIGLAICIEVSANANYATVSGNALWGGSMGVSISGANNATVSANTIYGPNWYGIELASAPHCAVGGNTVDGAGLLGGGWNGTQSTAAIVTDGGTGSDYASISGNNISGMIASNGSAAILLSSGVRHSITGNTLQAAAHGILSPGGLATITGNFIHGESLATSRGIDVSNRSTVTGNTIEGFERGVQLSATSGILDGVTVVGNTMSSVTNPIFPNLSGGATVGQGVKIDANGGTLTPTPSFVHVTDSVQGSSSAGFSANRVYYLRSRGSGLISSIGMAVGTSSGNIRVGVYRASGAGRAAVPSARVAESGSVACPVAGYATVPLGSTVWVNAGDYLAIICDNATATLVGFSQGSGSALVAPFSYLEDPGSFILPATATPNVGGANIYRLIGV